MADVKRAGAVGGWTRVVTARPRLTLLLALLFTALAVVAGSGVGGRLASGGWEAPDSQSSYATAALAQKFPASQPNLVLLVDSRGAGVDSAAVAAQGQDLARRLAADPAVSGVTSYWSAHAPVLRAKDGGSAMITARLRGDDDAVATAVKRIAPAYQGRRGPVTVSVGGTAAVRHELQTTIQEDLVRAEMIALPVTLLLLVMVFGSAIAALLPLGVGIVAILGTNAVLRGITEFTDVSVFAQNLTTALGLGLAIDYALFIVRRFREELGGGTTARAAVAVTLRTAGRTVLFSALTVAASLAAMLVFPQYFLRSFAYAGIAVVLLAAGAALVLLPACLVLLGDRVNALDLRKLLRRREGAREPGAGYARLARLVMRRAPLFAIGAVAGLLLLGLPFLQVRFGTADDRQLPSAAESHVVQQHIREEFPGSPDGALTVLTEGAGPAQLAGFQQKVAAIPGVVRVVGPVVSPDAKDAYLTVLPKGEAVDGGTQQLVGRIRAVPTDFRASVTGQAAVLVDSKHAIGDRLPWAAGIIALVTLLLIFLLTGSVVIPLQAVLLNALSLTAMFGSVVWVFQDGHLSDLLGFTATGSIETTLPVLMFCVAFGLSMDYGVFLLSRIKEEYDRGGDHRSSIVFGLQRTGGLITA
ncbi:MAG TPA: MMPL family transporter, partial [Streptomyces sp.]